MVKRKFISLIILVLLSVIFSGCKTETQPTLTPSLQTENPTIILPTQTTSPITTQQPIPKSGESLASLLTAPEGQYWWNDIIFYEIFIRSFSDSDGDGIGDFQGLINNLDYLNDGNLETTDDLGITGIWLMPVNQSPSYHGYDVIDYFDIESDYGTMQDFQQFLDEAHKRGIVVIMDLVLNHTSIQHPWFVRGQNSTSTSHDYYIWSETRPLASGWHSIGSGGPYYYGYFWSGMPDLNYTNPDVTAEMFEVTRFWLQEFGVDGYRLDAIRHLIEEDGEIENTPGTHNWLKEFRAVYKNANPNAVTVGEIWDISYNVRQYLKGDELDLAFHFDLATAFINGARDNRSLGISSAMRRAINDYSPNQYATFLTNHDQNRIMSHVRNDTDKAKMAAAILLTSPGVPFIYYGEEIGMTGIGAHENIRTPMQWTGESGAGFTSGNPWWDINPDYVEKNVSAQAIVSDSLLNWYRELIHLRNSHSALRSGDSYLVDTGTTDVYAMLRGNSDEQILIVVNLTDDVVTDYQLSRKQHSIESGIYNLISLFGNGTSSTLTIENGLFSKFKPLLSLEPYQVVVYSLSITD